MALSRFGELDVHLVGGTDEEGGGHGPLVVLLHGFGAPGDDLVTLSRVLDVPAGTRFAFPEAPIRLPREYAGGRAWWHIDLADRQRRQARGEVRSINEVPPGMVEARAALRTCFDELVAKLAPAGGQVVLGGFSQGAMLALDVALHDSAPLRGLVLMSGTHLAAEEWATRFPARRGLPVFMSHGQTDELLMFDVSERLRDTLESHGLPVTWVPFREGHAIPAGVVRAAGEFLTRVLA